MTDNPTFAAAFYPGQVLTDHNGLAEFHRFLPPPEGKTVTEYAQQLAEKGLAMVATSETIRDIPQYKALMTAARQAKLPLVITTNPQPEGWQDTQPASPLADPEARAKYIREQRDLAKPFYR